MNPYKIVTDSCSDMMPGYAKEHDVLELELSYTMGGTSYSCNDPELSREQFYKLIRGGEMPITAAVNMDQAVEALTKVLDEGIDVFCLMFSSALSGTYNSVRLAAEELAPKYPERRIIVIDSLAASGGEGLLVNTAVEYREAGKSIDECAEQVRAEIPVLAHLVAIDDLNHLRRGGRLSSASAVVGTMLGIKPIIHVDDEGRLIPVGKVRGRKQSLLEMVNMMEQLIDRKACKRFSIRHGDCLEDAKMVALEIVRRFGINDYTISFIDPTVGAHAGPGTVALFFLATGR